MTLPFVVTHVDVNIHCAQCGRLGGAASCEISDDSASSLRAQLRSWLLCGLFAAGWHERKSDGTLLCRGCVSEKQ